MKIEIVQCLAGAAQAKGVVVMIDVFRSGNTVAAMLAAGAPFVQPVSEVDEARALKAANPGWLLAGERGGVKIEDFDLDNSPAAAISMDLTNRPAVITTSAGTRGLQAASAQAQVLLMATLVNARLTADYIQALNPDVVTMVAIGLGAHTPAEEDDAVAEYLTDLLMGRPVDYHRTVRTMLTGSGGDRMRSLGLWRDLAWCLRRDYVGLIPRVTWEEGRMVLRPVAPDSRN
ncbi:MAG: 2-phosphosulfolactate phosphatase [Deltaproteobacteria bacterium]|nr:2-phosphosulfolactate phosphatase [Deltaproteobacteria bacterium]